jgi:hypothetical protein
MAELAAAASIAETRTASSQQKLAEINFSRLLKFAA